LVESELFGHVKGAFTGAFERRIGRFELADGGTILLDEVGDLHLEAQVKLLRVLQEHEFEPVGSSRSVRADVRVIAVTNRDLGEAVKAGQFRADLFYRLNVIPLDVPPLRDRSPDIPKLVMFFLERFSKKFDKWFDSVSQATMDRLVDYGWPGNVRELQNIIERAVVLSQGPVLALNADLLPAEVSDVRADPSGDNGDHTIAIAGGSSTRSSTSLEEIERLHILMVLQETGGLIEGPKGAAGILGLNPSTLRGRIKKLGIRRKSRQISRSHRELPQRPPSLADN
jgi:formate hydrogenlyase transcriptional activator